MMRFLSSLLLLAVLSIGAAHAAGLQLVMVETDTCPRCKQWKREIGVIYPFSPEGRAVPLEVINLRDVRGRLPASADIDYTPTFLLVRDGRELGRLTGYGGADHFWGGLEELLRQNRGR